MENNKNKRLYGGCFGCQIIADALGGKVGYNPSPDERKRFALLAETILIPDPEEFTSPAARDLAASMTTKSPKVIVSHGDCVLEMPEGSVKIASSASCNHEIFLAGQHLNILGVQR